VKDPTFTMDVWQSRLILGSEHRLREFRPVHSYFEFDFLGGGGGGVRVRHAHLDLGEPDEGGSFRIGQYWFTFGDDDAWPNVTDFDGPTLAVEALCGTHTTPMFDEPQGAFGSAGRLQFVTEYAF